MWVCDLLSVPVCVCLCGWSVRVVTLQLDSVSAAKQWFPRSPALSRLSTDSKVCHGIQMSEWLRREGVKEEAGDTKMNSGGWERVRHSKGPEGTRKSNTRERTREEHNAWKESYNSRAVAGKGQALYCEMSGLFNSLGGNDYGTVLNVICWVKPPSAATWKKGKRKPHLQYMPPFLYLKKAQLEIIPTSVIMKILEKLMSSPRSANMLLFNPTSMCIPSWGWEWRWDHLLPLAAPLTHGQNWQDCGNLAFWFLQ